MTQGKSQSFSRRTLAAAAVLLPTLIIGCSEDSSVVALPQISIEGPAEFQDQGRSWARSELEHADQKCLARFFQLNQQLVGSPEMDGKPLLFTSGKNDRRFYWLNPTANGSRWTSVHFEKGRFATSEGAGSPF